MSAVQYLNRDAEIASKQHALAITIGAAKGMQSILRSNLGPKGTLKMLVSGAGEIKLTKDGGVLVREMQIQHPTAMMIARTATAQDDETGDGTTSTVLIIGELMKQAERYLSEGVHPRMLTSGIEIALVKSLEYSEKAKVDKDVNDREVLMNVARTALCSKVHEKIVDQISEICVDAVLAIAPEDSSRGIDLHMVETMEMQHRMDTDSRLVRGIVMDHGARHPGMPRYLENCFILTCNVSLEYEKSEFNATFMYSNAEQRDKMVNAERSIVDDRVKQIIDLKRKVCDTPDKHFVIINQKGIDPLSLDMLAKEGIYALRRAKRRNMERLVLSCGGVAVNTSDDLSPEILGYAGKVFEQSLGDEKYCFVEDAKHPRSVTALLKGPNRHTIIQMKDALRDGLRVVKNTLEDKAICYGGGAFEVGCYMHLKNAALEVTGRARRGVEAFAESLLVVPKALAENAGADAEDAVIEMQEHHRDGVIVGLDAFTGDVMDPEANGVFDSVKVKRNLLAATASSAVSLLLVDEILRAGRSTHGPPPQ